MEFLGGEKQCQERKRFAPEVSQTSPEIPYLGAFLEVVRTVGMRTKQGSGHRTKLHIARPSHRHGNGEALQAGERTVPPPSSASVPVAASRPQGKLGTELPGAHTAFSSEAPDSPSATYSLLPLQILAGNIPSAVISLPLPPSGQAATDFSDVPSPRISELGGASGVVYFRTLPHFSWGDTEAGTSRPTLSCRWRAMIRAFFLAAATPGLAL